jgi:hypothetical protein
VKPKRETTVKKLKPSIRPEHHRKIIHIKYQTLPIVPFSTHVWTDPEMHI